jgi:hypothetical protein
MQGRIGVLLRRPLHGCFMWPLDVAGLGGRYLVTAFLERRGALRRNPLWIPASKDDFVGLHRLWCINLTLFSFIIGEIHHVPWGIT